MSPESEIKEPYVAFDIGELPKAVRLALPTPKNPPTVGCNICCPGISFTCSKILLRQTTFLL